MRDVDNVDVFVRTTLRSNHKAQSGSFMYIIRMKKNGEDKTRQGYGTLTADKEKVSEVELTLAAMNDALGRFREKCNICIHTNCRTVLNSCRNYWVQQWQKNGWRKSNGSSVKYADLWGVFEKCSSEHCITWSEDVKEFQKYMDDVLEDVEEGRKPNVDELLGADTRHGAVNEAEYEPA